MIALVLAVVVRLPVALRRVAKPDDHALYAMRGLLDLGGKDDVRFTGTYKERVVTLKDDVMTTSVESTVSVELMGMVRQGRPVQSERVERLDGTLVTAAKVDPTLLFGVARIDRLRAFYPPAKDVEVGTGWWHTEGRRDELTLPPASTFLRLEGDEKVGAKETWKVAIDANEADDASPVHVKGMIWLDKADGSLVKGQWTIDGYTYIATSPALHARFELTRVD